jgi:hypothetical protein
VTDDLTAVALGWTDLSVFTSLTGWAIALLATADYSALDDV